MKTPNLQLSGTEEISERCTDYISPKLDTSSSLDNPGIHLFSMPPERRPHFGLTVGCPALITLSAVI